MNPSGRPLRILLLGCGRMGSAHALAYHQSPEFELVALVARSDGSREKLADSLASSPSPRRYPQYADFTQALRETRPDAVSINTYADSHAAYALEAMEAGAHVFVEKPLATTWPDAENLVKTARRLKRKMVVGYLLRHHELYDRFVELSQGLGKPLVMRMSLNRQSQGPEWEAQKQLLDTSSLFLDGGVHYADLICRIAGGLPRSVQAMHARLRDDLPAGKANYANLQLRFGDGSVAWLELAYGPMFSRQADSLREVIGPLGSVTLHSPGRREVGTKTPGNAPSIPNAPAPTASLLLHSSRLDAAGGFTEEDREIISETETTHAELCRREQEFFLRCIRDDSDLSDHHLAVLNSLRIILAAEKSLLDGKAVELK